MNTLNRSPLKIGTTLLKNRLILGSGKFSSPEVMKQTLAAAETEVITMALRRLDLNNPQDSFLSHIDPEKIIFMPNTSGARTAEEAIRIAKIVQFSGISTWIKIEVTPEPNHLFPDPIDTLKAAETMVKMGLTVLPYMHADPILAKRLEDVGCAAVMPLAAPIGSNQGLKTQELIQIIIENATVPVIVDAGLGTPSHAAAAMEMGADAVLVNTAIATSANPPALAQAFHWAVQAGRQAFESGLATPQAHASASSPLTGFLHS
jgi:thiazole synthase